jgi:hypothetical protein
MEWRERLNDEISQSGTKQQSFRRNLKDCHLRFAGIVSTLKSTWNRFGVWNGVERAFKRRNISIRNEITEFSSKFERLRFSIYRDCFDAEIDTHYIRRVEWSGKGI